MGFTATDLRELRKRADAAKTETKEQSFKVLKRIGIVGTNGKLKSAYLVTPGKGRVRANLLRAVAKNQESALKRIRGGGSEKRLSDENSLEKRASVQKKRRKDS